MITWDNFYLFAIVAVALWILGAGFALFSNVKSRMACHTANPQLPFYANFPFAGKLVKEDIRLAYRSFDMDPMMEALKKGKKSVK
jgi:hypothetical protein